MENLEKELNNSESVQKNWLQGNIQKELWETLVSSNEDLNNQIMGIDNEVIKENIKYFFEKEIFTPERTQGEIDTYNRIKAAFLDEWFRPILDKILSNEKMKVLPSYLETQIQFYEKLKKVKANDERDVITHYIEEWLLPSLVYEEYEVYLDIKNYEYKSEDMKNYVLSLIRSWVRPKNVDRIFDLIKDNTECWPKTQRYIKQLLNTPFPA